MLTVLPSIVLTSCLAFFALYLESILPVHVIGSSVMALFIGMAISYFKAPSKNMNVGLKFISKKVLRLAIILLGASLSIGTILTVGKFSLAVMLFTLFTCFGVGYFTGKALGLNWKMSNLISAGTGICGGSAIAAIAPVIDASETDIAYGLSATFIFDMVMVIVFPLMGTALGLSDIAYGLWAGTAVNDTSSVVAASYAYSEAAGDYATMVKLTRTVAIIPIVIIFAFVAAHVKRKNNETPSNKKLNLFSVVPWFILGFLALAGLNSLGVIDPEVSYYLKELGKFLMIMALAAIGLSTNLKQMKSAGMAPMLHGFIISLLVVVVAIGVQYMLDIT